jgi:hypothetical protein
MSWLFSRALVAEYSAASSLDGEQFAPLSVMPTQHKFWRNDKTMEFSRLSQFGLTCAALTESRGAELLTSFLAAFPARTLAQPERAQESRETAADYGKSSLGLLARYDPVSCLWKTAQCSLFADSELSLETWPRWGSMLNGECYQQPMLELPTCEKGSGFWPTPCADDTADRAVPATVHISKTGLPKYVAPNGVKSMMRLSQAVRMWPTPAARDYRSPNKKPYSERGGGKKGEQLPNAVGGTLNPAWVEWLMGWPLGWTDLKPLATDKSHCAPPQHSVYLQNEPELAEL